MPGNTLARRLLAGLTAGFLVVLGGVAPANPADSDGLSSSASAYLAGIGTSVLWPVAIAALLVVLGGAALWLSRRRRAGDAG